MRWIFLTLVLLNLMLFSAQWFGVGKETSVGSSYQVQDKIPTITLLRELATSADTVDSRNKGSGVVDKCLLVGPLDGRNSANALMSRLRAMGFEVSLISQDLKKAPSYWVYYGPFSGMSEALKQLKEFQEQNIDSFIITSGELKDNISLGIFRNIDLAQRLVSDMKRKGYDAKMEQIKKIDKENWIALNKGYPIEKYKKMTAYISALDNPPEMRQILCKSIASPNKLP